MPQPLRRPAIGLLVALGAAALASTTVAGAGKPVDFAHDVAPILKAHCAECHGDEEAEGGFSINTRDLILDAEAAVPGNAAESWMIELVTSDDVLIQMPPKKRPRIPAEAVATLRAWIDDGLDWEPGFSFAEARYEPPLRPRRPDLPPAVDGRDNLVDRFLDAGLARRGTPRPRPIDDAAFQRRLLLDVVGLLPTPDQRAAFLADPDPDKRAKLIRAVLDDRVAFAEHWLTFWNDLLRNDYAGTGYIDGGRKMITGWLYRALLEEMPYDRFVRDLIAPGKDADGFINGIKWRGTVNASQVREVQFAQNISQVFLGINMKCASCHDSFIDRWTLDEAYGLAAIYATDPLEVNRCDKPTGRMARAAWIFPELGQIDPEVPQPERLEQLADLMVHPENGRTTRTIVNRVWDRLMGRGLVHPVDAMHTPPWEPDLLDALAVRFADDGYDLKALIALIANSAAYQSETASLEEEPAVGEYTYSGPLARRLTAEQFVDAVWQVTGTWPDKPDKKFADAVGPEDLESIRGGRPVRAALLRADLLMRSLGRPNREQVVTTRPAVLTTLEALDLANGQILADTLRRGTSALLEHHRGSADDLIDRLYRHALSRDPSPREREVARELLDTPPTPEGLEDLLWALFMLPEFQLIR